MNNISPNKRYCRDDKSEEVNVTENVSAIEDELADKQVVLGCEWQVDEVDIEWQLWQRVVPCH